MNREHSELLLRQGNATPVEVAARPGSVRDEHLVDGHNQSMVHTPPVGEDLISMQLMCVARIVHNNEGTNLETGLQEVLEGEALIDDTGRHVAAAS